MKLFNILVLLLVVTFGNLTRANDETLGQVISDIYRTGELDGQSVFLVLGMDDAKDIAKNRLNRTTTLEELKEIGVDFGHELKKTSRLAYNGGEGDLVKAAENGLEFSKEAAKYMLTGPKDTLKKLPNAFKVQMHNAREGYYESESEIVGGFKYAGHASWILVEGSYYLLVEAPAKVVFSALGAMLGVPAAVGLQGALIATALVIDVGTFTLNLAYEAIKTSYNVLLAAAVYSYSAITTTTMAVATTVVALPVYAYQAFKYWRPRVKLGGQKLDIANNEENRKKAITIATETLQNFASSINVKAETATIKVKKLFRNLGPKSNRARKLRGYTVSLIDKGRNIVKISISLSAKKIKLTGGLQYRKYKELQNENFSKEQLRAMFESSLAI